MLKRGKLAPPFGKGGLRWILKMLFNVAILMTVLCNTRITGDSVSASGRVEIIISRKIAAYMELSATLKKMS